MLFQNAASRPSRIACEVGADILARILFSITMTSAWDEAGEPAQCSLISIGFVGANRAEFDWTKALQCCPVFWLELL